MAMDVPGRYQVHVAGEVPDEFDEKKYVEIKDRPHVSRAVPLAAASVAEAVADAGVDVEATRSAARTFTARSPATVPPAKPVTG